MGRAVRWRGRGGRVEPPPQGPAGAFAARSAGAVFQPAFPCCQELAEGVHGAFCRGSVWRRVSGGTRGRCFPVCPFCRKRGGRDSGARWRRLVVVFSPRCSISYSCMLVFLSSTHFEKKNVVFQL